ncbi:MAG: hypothetical protein IIU55_03280 [Paludibacteraceae bacterium]|jgi:hypothetical protein|nr:hypothetical protein [Paludibacteraceae bacterium]
MSKIKPIAIVESMSGKICQHSDMYFRTNRQTNQVCTGKICNPSDAAPTVAQEKVMTRFTNITNAARAILADPTQKAKYEAAYKAQHRVGSLLGFIVKKIKNQYDENGELIS